MKNLISIIIPIYNCEKYISRCLNSIINQTYSNIEIIVIDDGSTDGSYDICREFEKRDKRIITLCQENKGVSSARNLGIKHSKGEFVTFIDSDDWVDRKYCEILLNGMKEDTQLSVVGIKKVTDLNEEKSNKYSYDYNQISRDEAFKLIFTDSNFFGFSVNKLYKKDIIDSLDDKPFDEEIFACEDTLFNAKYISKCNKVSYNMTQLYFYFMRDDSATKTKVFNKKKETVFESLDRIEDIYMNISNKNLVYLYIFYMYNYYLLSLLIFHDKSNYKLNNNKVKKAYRYIIKSRQVDISTKIKVFVKYKMPIINEKLYNLKEKIKGENRK